MKIFKTIKLADYVTLFNFISGFLSIIFSFKGELFIASVLILVGVIFDFLDGKIARLTKTSNDFGKELDSLSDAVTFGVAPAVLGYAAGLDNWYSILILAFFASCGVLRLARFSTLNIKGFLGVPITTNGIVFSHAYFFMTFFGYSFNNYILLLYLIMGFLMISDLRIKKL